MRECSGKRRDRGIGVPGEHKGSANGREEKEKESRDARTSKPVGKKRRKGKRKEGRGKRVFLAPVAPAVSSRATE
jgi:hypothetical protein